MRKKLIIKGNTVEEKIDHIEIILQRFQRRLHKTVIGAIPPIPVQSHADHPKEDGGIVKHILPADGRIMKGAIAVGKYSSSKAVQFDCLVQRMDGSSASQSFKTRKHAHVVGLDLEVKAGDLLSISTPSAKDEKGNWIIEDIWVAILYEIAMKESVLKKHLIDSLEEIASERV